jgi:hypothetical protein
VNFKLVFLDLSPIYPYWSANINTSSKGKINTAFYTSDVSGKYAIVIQGISKQGQPLYKEITFIVQ